MFALITEQDLLSAIAECQGERDPNANTCIKLAAFYTIYNQLYGKSEQVTRQMSEYSNNYSYAPAPVQEKISYFSDTEFSQAMQGRSVDKIMPILDELMSTLAILYPRLYDGVMRKIRDT